MQSSLRGGNLNIKATVNLAVSRSLVDLSNETTYQSVSAALQRSLARALGLDPAAIIIMGIRVKPTRRKLAYRILSVMRAARLLQGDSAEVVVSWIRQLVTYQAHSHPFYCFPMPVLVGGLRNQCTCG